MFEKESRQKFEMKARQFFEIEDKYLILVWTVVRDGG